MVIPLTKELFTKITTEKLSAVVDIFAIWCGPCKMVKPHFHALAQELTNYTFTELNVDEERELSVQFGVSSIPTFVFIKDGIVVAKEVGALSKDTLRAKIQLHLG
jgi:thioredoxin 1